MKRRRFINLGAAIGGGSLVMRYIPASALTTAAGLSDPGNDPLYTLFDNPGTEYRPFVRWWWNGDKVEAEELVRELNLLKDAGIGGVEINPISFPSREEGDDLGIASLEWLSDDWISMLQVVFDEAKRLGMQCDLIVGSGWPFGSESLTEKERASVILVYAEHIEGPTPFTIPVESIYKAVDPGVTVPFPGRTFTIVSLALTPEPMSGLHDVTPIALPDGESIIVNVPPGKHVFYALVRVDSFASVINGAPGAAGPILNHMDREAVKG
ncbi:MAG: glycosyl hydrolase, partial [Bacteroidales bacterium]